MEECTFCFLCLKGLRGSKSQCGGDEVKVVRKGTGRNNNTDREINSIRILMTYLLNTADNKYDSVLKGVLKLAGVISDGDHQEEGEGLTFPSKCFRLCDKCDGISGMILELHLELEKVQMKIVQEVKTVRASIQKSSGWLGGTAQGMVNESEEAFENFARMFFDGDLTTKTRGTFGFLKTLRAAIADIDKDAVLVPSVYLDKYAIAPARVNAELLVGGHATDIFKTEPNDAEDEAMEEPWACQEESFGPSHCLSDNNEGDVNGDDGATSDDTFASSLVSHISNLTHSTLTPAQVPGNISSEVLGQPTKRRGRGRPQKQKVSKYKQSQSGFAVEVTGEKRGRPPKAKPEYFENTLENSELLVGSSTNVGSWKTAGGDDEDIGLQQEEERAGSVSLDPEPNSKTAGSELPKQTFEEPRRGPYIKRKKRGWAHVKKHTSTRPVQSSELNTGRPSPSPQQKPTQDTKVLAGGRSNPDSLRLRSPPVFKSEDQDEDIDIDESPHDEDADADSSFSLDEEDSDSSDSICDSDGDYKMPRPKKERLVESTKSTRLSGAKNRRPRKRKSSQLFYDDDLIDRAKLPKAAPVEGPTPLRRIRKNFNCEVESCKYKTRAMFTLEQHLRSHETEEKIFNCEPCNQGFSNEQNYRLHEGRHRGHHKLKCAVCRSHFSSFEIADHVKSHFDTVFPCPYCSHCLPSVKLHLAHLQRYHKSVEWKCVICGEIFQNMNELGDHLQEAHQAVEKINCSYRDCDRSYYDPESLRAHKKIHRMKLGCAKCDRHFGTQALFDLHQEFHRTGKPYKCDLGNCSEAFPNKASLKKHKVEDHQFEKQVCEVCGKEFSNSGILKNHRITIHGLGGGKPCPVCNRLFPSAKPLQRHMEQSHSTSKNYICEDCGKAFKTMDKCNSHRQIHGEPTHQCPHCPKAFHQRPSLNDHIRIHTGEKPYPCRLCGEGYRQASTRNKHESVCQRSSRSRNKLSEEKMEPDKDNEPNCSTSQAVEVKIDVLYPNNLSSS